MAIHPRLSESPYDALLPEHRWFPAAEELREKSYEKLLPPLVAKVRTEVKAWRDAGYAGASETSRALLGWWFDTEHLVEQADATLNPFRYYFAQREAVETVIDALDIALPRLTRRFNREYKQLDALDPAKLGNPKLPLKPFTPEETREIVFKTMLDAEVHHTIQLDGAGPADYRSVVAYFARQVLKDLRLVGGYDILYGKVKTFLQNQLFTLSPVNLEDAIVLRNLSEPEAGKILFDSFKAAINALTVTDSGSTRIEDYIRLRSTRPFRTEHRPYLTAKKTIFSKIVGEPRAGGFELRFAKFLDDAPDVAAFAKNYLAVGFKIDYVKTDGDLSTYMPDFIIRTTDGTIWIVETKGREELDLPQKMARLRLWCEDATSASADDGGHRYRFVYVDQKGFEQNAPQTFASLAASFTEYQDT